MGNACYYSVEKLLSSSLLSKNLKVRIYKTVILPVLLYGCETWTLTLREEHRLRVYENKVLRTIFGAKRDEVTGEWRKLHNTKLHALYSSPDIIRNIKSRRLRWAGHVARMGESRNAYRVLVGRPEGKRPLGRPRRRWEDNIKMDVREVGYDDRDWINLAQDRDRWRAYVRAAMNLRLSQVAEARPHLPQSISRSCLEVKMLRNLKPTNEQEKYNDEGEEDDDEDDDDDYGDNDEYDDHIELAILKKIDPFWKGYITTLSDAKYTYVKIIEACKKCGFVISKKDIIVYLIRLAKLGWEKQANPPPPRHKSPHPTR
ncbi:hypothetical protein ANN_22640 [Periplaneta americana]|uniref:Uncharacterized protein n=1 Tax=Periplaneta americana TaxID=6978 RepID=A0ABQ8S8N9_PERAM|nr:hypothetical protein ANN_22640 [Periplaneta americana]